MTALATYRAVAEHVRDIVLVIEPDSGRIVEANRAAELAYQYTRDELLARTIFDLRIAPAASVVVQMQVADRDGVQFEGLHRRRDGSEFPVEVSSRGETLSGRRLLLSIIRDITARRALEAEREQLLETTRRALALRDEFLIVASHELRTPVTSVGLQLHQLGRMLDRAAPTDRQRAAVDAALREVNRLGTLIDRLLEAQVTSGELALTVEEVELGQLVRDLADRHRIQADQVGSSLEVDVEEVRGRWDRLRLEQVVTNLVINALKYGAGHPVSLAVRAGPGEARLEVRDRGIGIAREDVDRIFDKFERAAPITSFGGLGLGLYITRQIVEAHAGRIEVETAPELGAVFRVVLPR